MTEVHYRLSGSVAEIAFDGPERKNAIARTTVDALEAALDRAAGDAAAVLLYGENGTFVAGGDLVDLHQATVEEALAVMARMKGLLAGLLRAPYTVVAYVEGDAVGGGVEIALAADIILCHPAARFTFAQVPLGLVPGWGGTAALLRRLPAARARALLLAGRRLDAAAALVAGIVDEIVPDLAAARRETARLAALPRAAVAAAKALTGDLPPSADETFRRLWTDPAHQVRVDQFFKGDGHDG